MLFLDCAGWCKSRGRTLDELLKAGFRRRRRMAGRQGSSAAPSHIRMNLALPLPPGAGGVRQAGPLRIQCLTPGNGFLD
jgi:hypothetical protein